MVVVKERHSASPLSVRSLPKIAAFAMLIILIYLMGILQAHSLTEKDIFVTINGLTETYPTTSKTVGKFLAEIGIPSNQIVAVAPPLGAKLSVESMVMVETKPKLRDAIVAANFSSTVKAVEAAEAKAEAEAKAAAEAKSVAAEALKPVTPKSPTYVGVASWYKFGNGMNAASTQFPRGTKLRVTNEDNGKIIDVTINDYGPEDWTGVMLDLNKAAFAKLAPVGLGKINIKYFKI
ncbi:MAG: septal ring lytic transglycosylase RlpA family protein [Patescibacteria group bacterium]